MREIAEGVALAATAKFRLIASLVALALFLLFVLIIGSSMMAVLTGSSAAGACGPNQGGTLPVADNDNGAADEQVQNAQLIDKAAAALGLSGKASRIAIITALGESSLINIAHDDDATNPDGSTADGGGLFQQQPSQGWGTWEQIMDPTYAATSFLIGAKHDRSGGLVSVAGWETMEPTLAIHKVQINSDPNHYARFYAEADEIISRAGIDVNRTGEGAGTGPVECVPVGPIGAAVYPLDQPYNMTSGFGPRDIDIPGASSWHPAIDYQNWPNPCGQPVYAVLPGTVITSDRLWLSIKSEEGYVISYLHMYKSERVVGVGETVTAGQKIGAVGNEGPSGGCHLDIRIDVSGNTNPQVAALPRGDASAGAGNYVNPLDFFPLFGLDSCPDWCSKP
ncbi:MAG: M23 family metallopeptidase [Microbacterium sp.]|uniref:M23 family metallopeptidase n=1 Tax=Microbacterium sp. TaxID=51671 RepID=UPI001D668642|nr:M23 family metallopeptidase [Microbacterium sp.]MBW8764527.1 M23 family metallopeptidase [Microbacterium sp.]